MTTRRSFILGSTATVALPGALLARGRADYKEYDFVDYFEVGIPKGSAKSLPQDIAKATQIAAAMPKDDHYNIMSALAKITQRGSSGELFSARWKTRANPLIVKFFHDVGYKETPYPGDCTPWCAATISWCLQRSGRRIPASPASSQSYLSYGQNVDDPKPGDICVFTNIGDSGHGHVGLFVSKTADHVMVLGGNQLGESTTNCGPGYRQSKIHVAKMAINPSKDHAVSLHYLHAFVRPI